MTDVQRAPVTRVTATKIMAQMAKLVRTALPTPIVWETARDVITAVAPRDEVTQATTVRDWIVAHFQFVNDPLNVQLLTDPVYMLEHIRDAGKVLGNCADAAMLAAALCEAIRIRCRFVSVGFENDPSHQYSHVFTMAYPHDQFGTLHVVEFDVTRPPGLEAAHFARHLSAAV